MLEKESARGAPRASVVICSSVFSIVPLCFLQCNEEDALWNGNLHNMRKTHQLSDFCTYPMIFLSERKVA